MLMNNEVKRILIVDDSPKDVELVISAITEKNLAYAVDIAEDGEEALDYLYKRNKFAARVVPAGRQENANPCVILLDIKLPGMDGIEVLKHIRSNPEFKTIPIIMITSSHEERNKVESYKQGANSYVVKSNDITQLTDAIKVFGKYWTVINQSIALGDINLKIL